MGEHSVRALSHRAQTWRVQRRTRKGREQLPLGDPEQLPHEVNHWLASLEEVTLFFSQTMRCPGDPELERFGGMSAITWQPTSGELRLMVSLETDALFRTESVGWEVASRRSRWLRQLADELWDAVHPDRLVTDVNVLELLYDPTLPPGLPWLVYVRAPDVLQRTIEGVLKTPGVKRGTQELCELLRRYAYEVQCNGTGRLKVCFTETLDGYTAGGRVIPAPQSKFLKAWQS